MDREPDEELDGRADAARRELRSDRGSEPGPAPERLRFTRVQHLRRAADFRRVYREGTRVHGERFTVALLPNGLAHSRLGLSVGKRCWKGAVRRNRVRRVLREAFRLSQHELGEPLDLVLIGSTPKLVADLEPIRRDLLQLVERGRKKRARVGERPPGRGGKG